MMLNLYFMVPGDISQNTGGYVYDRRMIRLLREKGWSVTLYELPGRYPFLNYRDKSVIKDMMAKIPDGELVLIDGLALSAISDLIKIHGDRLAIVALVHLLTCFEKGLNEEEKAIAFKREIEALAHVKKVIVTSRSTARTLADQGISNVSVVLPGTDPAPLSEGSVAKTGRVELLCVATLTPRKGHLILLKALEGIRNLSWHLTCVGSNKRDKNTAEAIVKFINDNGLEEHVSIKGEVDEGSLKSCYMSADVFVLASYYESYGMVLAEAISYGLPIVSTDVGGIPEVVPPYAGILVPPGDLEGLRDALYRVIQEEGLRLKLAEGARIARRKLPTWDSSANSLDLEIRKVLNRR